MADGGFEGAEDFGVLVVGGAGGVGGGGEPHFLEGWGFGAVLI